MDSIALQAVVGSTAYGLNHADSDIDQLGVFVEPTETILSLRQPNETHVSNNPDLTMHEVGKFVRLAVKCNPTVLELLFLDEYVTTSEDGQALIDAREHFLGEVLIRNAYIGYATSQIKRLEKRGDFGSDLKKRYAKHARHCFRLLLQAEQLLTTGKMQVKVSPEQRDYLFSLGEMPIEDLSKEFDKATDSLDAVVSVVPEQANLEAVNQVLLDIRRRNYGDQSKVPRPQPQRWLEF